MLSRGLPDPEPEAGRLHGPALPWVWSSPVLSSVSDFRHFLGRQHFSVEQQVWTFWEVSLIVRKPVATCLCSFCNSCEQLPQVKSVWVRCLWCLVPRLMSARAATKVLRRFILRDSAESQ